MEPTCSSQIAQIMIEGMEEVVGAEDLRGVFAYSQVISEPRLSYRDVCQFQEAVEASFGPRGGRGVLCRSGRAAFKRFLPGFWAHLGMTNLQYRLMPTPARIKIGLRALAQAMAEMYDQEIEVEDTADLWTWRMKTCPHCYERQSRGPVCDFAVGVLQEYLSWTSSGRFYMVEEVECLSAGGQACTIQIQKRPLD